MLEVAVVGGGLAGSEAAWQLAERGHRVALYEMRPVVTTPAHQTDGLAELVCSNSFKSQEITNLRGVRKLTLGSEPFKQAIGSYVLGDARSAMKEGDWATARNLFQAAWDSGFTTAEVACSLGRAQLGGFAFAASEQEKEAAEKYLLEAKRIDPRYADTYKALGELYGEWERYDEAAAMYRSYLKVEPKARDRSRIEAQIRKFERKARR